MAIISKLVPAAALAAIALLSINTAKAETVTVPFTFRAQGQLFPAGQYRVNNTLGNGFVTVRSLDGSRSFTSVVGPGAPAPSDERVVLRFDNASATHELRSIQYHNQITGRLDRGTATAERQAGE
ncbi:MAG: hypothetical protein ACLGSD_19160 [Acidobacteriota bacterium]